MSTKDVVKQGYAKVRRNRFAKWNKRWMKLRNEKNGYPKRLEKYADEETAKNDGKVKRIYELSEIKYVDRIKESRVKHAIQMVLSDFSTLQLACDSEMEAENWLSAFQGLKDGVLTKKDIFEVYLLKSKALDGSGECLLQVRADSICLLDIDNPQRVQLTWPLSCIRKYSTERGMFVIETGRSSPTGEGQFIFDCKCADDIYDCVQAATEKMAKENRRAATGNRKQHLDSVGVEAELEYHASMNYAGAMQSTHDKEKPPPYTAPTPATDKNRRVVSNKLNEYEEPRPGLVPGGRSSNALQTTGSARQKDSGQSIRSHKTTSSDSSDYELELQYNSIRGQGHGQGHRQSTQSRTYVGQSEVYSKPLSANQERPGNFNMSERSWRQDEDDDDINSPTEQQPTKPPRGQKKSSRNQSQNVCYEQTDLRASVNTGTSQNVCYEQTDLRASVNTGTSQNVCYEQTDLRASVNTDTWQQDENWQRDENDNAGAYYIARPPLAKSQSTSRGTSTSRPIGQSRSCGTSMSSDTATSVSRGTSTSSQVYASVKDKDDKDLEHALKSAFNETGLHSSLCVDRVILEDYQNYQDFKDNAN